MWEGVNGGVNRSSRVEWGKRGHLKLQETAASDNFLFLQDKCEKLSERKKEHTVKCEWN